MIALVTPEMLWRSVVWLRLHRAGKLPRNSDGPDGKSAHPGGAA
jgi:hypothetical protein